MTTTSTWWLVRLSDRGDGAAVAGLRRLLPDAGDVGGAPGTGSAASRPDTGVVIVCVDEPLAADEVAWLLGRHGPVVLAGPTLEHGDRDGRLADAAGLVLAGSTPEHDARLRPGPHAGPLARRLVDHVHGTGAHLGDHTHLRTRVPLVGKVTDDVEVLLTASVGLTAQPVATWRRATSVMTWSPWSRDGLAGRTLPRLLALALRRAAGVVEPRPARIGLLGYGAIGHEHSRAVRGVEGLDLAVVCDTSPDRLEAAREGAGDTALRTTTSPQDLLDADDVDLVVVSTPPSSHARWALEAVARGKHVVVEKPFAIRTDEADEVLAAAAERDLVACVYQNRRFDPDHLALRSLVRSGSLGEVFHLEAFVGGYGHPCNLWHSDEEVSGGAFYDWGAHVLDQVLDLLPGDVEHVTAATHKRQWHDVTNADHTRVTLRMTDGAEAEFVHSDLAAALKPRWYVLGTRGAVVGHWRTERVVGRTDIGTLHEDVLAPADSPPRLELHTPDGSVTHVATPAPPPYAFHTELADRLLLGLAMSVTGEQSRRVLSVMEAAAASARDGGRPVAPR